MTEDGSEQPAAMASAATSVSDLTVNETHHSASSTLAPPVLGPRDSKPSAGVSKDFAAPSSRPVKTTGLFTTQGTLPLPDHGERALGLSFENVTVYGAGGTRRTVEGFEKAVFKVRLVSDVRQPIEVDWSLCEQMWDLPGFVCKLCNIKLGQKRPLIQDFAGVLLAGETMLVLGRPGSGCSTLLRVIANQRDSFAGVDGEVQYGRLSSKEAAKAYSGDIVFNSEDDIHRPLLPVAKTLGSALVRLVYDHASLTVFASSTEVFATVPQEAAR